MKPITDWAWLAGFIEGEGTFQVVAEKHVNIYPQIAATSVDRILLDRCREIAGGNVWGPFGRSHINNPLWRPAYRWQLRSEALSDAIEMMLPFLITKKDRAAICLLLRRNTHMGSPKGRFGRIALPEEFKHWRLQLRLAVMALNRRGTKPLSVEELAAVDFAMAEVDRFAQTTVHQRRDAA